MNNGWTGDNLLIELLTEYPDIDAKKLYHIVRTPTWVIPPRIQAWKMLGQASEALGSIELDEKENFSHATIERFKSDPEFYRRFVKGIEKEVNNVFPVVSTPPSRLMLDKLTMRRELSSSKTAPYKHLLEQK